MWRAQLSGRIVSADTATEELPKKNHARQEEDVNAENLLKKGTAAENLLKKGTAAENLLKKGTAAENLLKKGVKNAINFF